MTTAPSTHRLSKSVRTQGDTRPQHKFTSVVGLKVKKVLQKAHNSELVLVKEITGTLLKKHDRYMLKVVSKRSFDYIDMNTRNSEYYKRYIEGKVLKHIRKGDFPFILKNLGLFQDPANLYLISEYPGGGELSTLLKRQTQHPVLEQRIPESAVRIYAAEILSAIMYLHQCAIIFRDLNPDNIFLGSDGHILLTNFKNACISPIPAESAPFCGDLAYMAPEMIDNGYDFPVDHYALGVIIFEMLVGRKPFDPVTPELTRTDVLARRRDSITIRWPRDFSKTYSVRATNIITSLLQRNPANRIGSPNTGEDELKRHPWFSKVHEEKWGPIDWERLERKEYKAFYVPNEEEIATASAYDCSGTPPDIVKLGTKMEPGISDDMDPWRTQFPMFESSPVS